MKKGQIVEGRVYRVDFPNKGRVWTAEEEEVLVKNALEGQTVRVRVEKKRKAKAEGSILEVLKPAENELKEPYCPHFTQCGGCTYQNIRYEDQLILKERQVKDLITEVIHAEKHCVSAQECGVSPCPMKKNAVNAVWQTIKPSPLQFEYRNKMEFSFGDAYKDGPLALGMHKRGNFYDIVSVSECKITDSDFHKILMMTQEFFHNCQASFYHKVRHTGYLRHLLVRKAKRTEEILVDLVTTTQLDEAVLKYYEDEKALLAAFAKKLEELELKGKLVGVLHTKNDGVADAIIDEGTEILVGQDHFYEELLGLKFKISPFSFFQTNSLGAEVLYETVRDYIGDLGKESVVFDLYSGTGTIAQMLSPVAKKVIGVEIIEEAVEAARQNAALNGIENCEFIAGDVLKVLETMKEKPDFIVLDPPRDGVHPKALERIIEYGVDRMVYISCKPTSLARDLEILQAHGYEVKQIGCVDMFPGTVHVETVCLLSKLNVKHHIEVELNLDEMDSDGASG